MYEYITTAAYITRRLQHHVNRVSNICFMSMSQHSMVEQVHPEKSTGSPKSK